MKYARLKQKDRKFAIESCWIVAQKQHIALLTAAYLPNKNDEYRYKAYLKALAFDFSLFKGVAGTYIKQLCAAVRFLRKLQSDNKKIGGGIYSLSPEKVAKLLNRDPDVIRNEIRHYAVHGTFLNKSDDAFKDSHKIDLPDTELEHGRDRGDQTSSAPNPCSDQKTHTIQPEREACPHVPAEDQEFRKEVDESLYERLEQHDDSCPPIYYQAYSLDPVEVRRRQENRIKKWFYKSSCNSHRWLNNVVLPKPIAELRAILGNFTNHPAFV